MTIQKTNIILKKRQAMTKKKADRMTVITDLPDSPDGKRSMSLNISVNRAGKIDVETGGKDAEHQYLMRTQQVFYDTHKGG